MIAWLRFLRAQDGHGIQAGLLETSASGDPLGFSFIRGTIQGPEDECGLPFLANSLFRSCATTPTLLVGYAEEIPSRQFGALNFSVPFCCVISATREREGNSGPEPPPGAGYELLWADEAPGGQIAACEALDRMRQWREPLEPLERTGRTLAAAFADPRVRALAEITGLRTLTSLVPRTGFATNPTSDSAGSGTAFSGHEAQGGTESDLGERLWAMLAVPRNDYCAGQPAQLKWPGSLMPFQREGVQALITMDRLLLSDDMGLGKTVQAVAALRVLRTGGTIRSGLVVTPASLLDQWRQELARWAPELSAIIVRGGVNDRIWQWKARKDVTLVSYEVLRQDANDIARHRDPGIPWGVVVLDEAQRIKNRNETSEVIKRIPRQRSWALTGTPIENDESDLASIMEFVDHDEGAPSKRYSPGEALRKRHRALQLRRKKADVLQDLPSKLETRLTVALRKEQRESYDRAEHEGVVYLKSLGADIGVNHVLELITRLKEICNADPKTGASSKLDDIGGRLEVLAGRGHKALIFSQYTSETWGVAAAANHLRAFNPLTLTGETPANQRSELVNRFKASDGHKVLIVSLRAGGLGLNLQEASYVFHLDRWWNPAVERQADDRSHRLGQTVKVNVIKYTCEDTIEQRIDQVLRQKQELFDELIDDVSMDLSTSMNREELLNLFGLG